MKKALTITLNILHFLYCVICFCALDTPLLFKWEWYYAILYYVLTLPLFIWGIIRFRNDLLEEQEEQE